jgi:hypothetical protein
VLGPLIATGLSVGWIMGLSASAVAHAVLATLLGLTNALLIVVPTIDRGMEQQRRGWYLSRGARDESLMLVGIFSLFLAGGATAGVFTRANDLLGLRPSLVTSKWAPVGLSKDVIAERLFDQVYPKMPDTHSEKTDFSLESSGNPHQGALYSSPGQKECDEYNSVEDADLRRLMLASSNRPAKALAESSTDPRVLRVAVKEFLCAR